MRDAYSAYSIVQYLPFPGMNLRDRACRVESPGKALSGLEDVKAVVDITSLHRLGPSLIREADILVLHHPCDPDLLPVIAERKSRGLVTIYEIAENIDEAPPVKGFCGLRNIEEERALFYRLLFSCDGVQAASRELLKTFGGLNDARAFFPSCLPGIPPERRESYGTGLVIGWGEASSPDAAQTPDRMDRENIRAIAPVLISWLRSNPRIRLALMAGDEVLKLFADLPQAQKLFRKPGTARDYAGFLGTIDIGLAPLLDTPYNRCRSDIRFVEYAAHGAVPVLQDMAPYRDDAVTGGTRYLFKHSGELVHILDQLASKPDLCRDIRQKAWAYVKERRLESGYARARMDFYCGLFKASPSHPQNAAPGSQERRRAVDAFRGYVPDLGTAFEESLRHGLLCLENDAPNEARRHFRHAEKMVPGHFLPPLFLSRCCADPIGELKKSLERNFQGLNARMQLAEIHGQRGNFPEALTVYRDAIQLCPEYDAPYRRSSEILWRLNMKKEAESLDRMAADLCLRKKKPAAGRPTLREPQARAGGIYLVMPRGVNYGWGICGKYLAREISALEKTRYVTEPFTAEEIGDELDDRLLRELCLSREELEALLHEAGGKPLDEPVIQAIQGNNLLPWGPRIASRRRIGYTFFEDNVLSRESIRNGEENFDVVVAGSRWCEEILQDQGLRNTRTILQGVDPDIFHPRENGKQYFKDRFVVFSGGKLELRKGQDIVIRAFSHLARKYDDVFLVISWYNQWPASLQSMAASRHIHFESPNGDYQAFIRRLLESNGVPPEKVLSLPPKPNMMMPRIYQNTDIGLFPNRCEGGTNLVLMEYMACGKPVVASFASGHRDILTEENALPVFGMKKMNVRRNSTLTAVWDDPDLDETVEKLEWAYLNREKLGRIGAKAGEDLGRLTWAETARQFHQLARGMDE